MIFKLSYGNWDSKDEYLFSHDYPANSSLAPKTPEEFREDVNFLLRKYGKEFLDSCGEEQWASMDNWISFIVPKFKELGYLHIIPQYSVDFVGCHILKEEDAYDRQTKQFLNSIGEELTQKAFEHNLNVEKAIDG